MRTSASTPCEQEPAQVCAHQTVPAKAHFRRVLVRRVRGGPYTSIGICDEHFAEAKKWAYGEDAGVYAALRDAALVVKETRRGYVSDAVRARALAALRGAYQPAKAAALTAAREADSALAEENNSAWESAVHGVGHGKNHSPG